MAKRKPTHPELVQAMWTGDMALVKRLLAAGHPVDELDRGGRTPLLNAIIDNELGFARLFIKHGAHVNHQDSAGWSALHFAAQESAPKAVALLLETGTDPDCRDEDGNTPLMTAVFHGHDLGVIKALLAAGASPFAKNDDGVSPAELASDSTADDAEVAEYLKQAAALFRKTRNKKRRKS